MEENVAIDSTKQKQFVKSIKGIKKFIKRKSVESIQGNAIDINAEGKVRKTKRVPRGLVYLAHIPHGFYEHEMTQYFKQFGCVTSVRVIRSKKTGKSKGFAFVEFQQPEVAQIVAETMNNYLMGKRLLKATYIPPNKQRKAFRKNWNALSNPARDETLKVKKAHNTNVDDKGDLKRARILLSTLNKTKKKLKALGIDYDFFTPVDVPLALQSAIEVKIEKEESKPEKKVEAKVKPKIKIEDVKDNKKNKKL